jgi:chromosome segregation ATPase
MIYKNKLLFTLFVWPLVAIALSGCDRHKAEKAELSKQIAVIEADLVPLNEEQGQVSKEVETLNADVKQQSDTLQPHLDQRTQLEDELAAYVEAHQTTALVLKMTRTGVAAVLDSKANQKTKDLIRASDAISKLLAVAYCVKKGQECRNATIKIMALGSQIDSENQTISLMTAQLDQKKASLQERQQKVSSLDATIAAKTKERDDLKQRLESLS